MNRNFPSTLFHGTHASIFNHQELRQILGAYSEGVLKKNWRDYAIASEPDQTAFYVVDRAGGEGMSVMYSISKVRSSKNKDQYYYRVFDGEKQICRTQKFMEALSVFRDSGKVKKQSLKLVR